MKVQKNPIGVFDSGYGGLTILTELVKELPQYDYLRKMCWNDRVKGHRLRTVKLRGQISQGLVLPINH